MAISEVGRTCMLCCGLRRKREEAPDTTYRRSENDYATADSVESDMQPTDYYNVNEVKDMFHLREQSPALYEEVPREELAGDDSGPIYAVAAISVGLNSKKRNTKPPKATPRSVSVKEKQDKGRLAQTFGADGTLYMDVRRTLPSGMSPPTHKPLFKKSEYAHIDHTLAQIPAPPNLNLSH